MKSAVDRRENGLWFWEQLAPGPAVRKAQPIAKIDVCSIPTGTVGNKKSGIPATPFPNVLPTGY